MSFEVQGKIKEVMPVQTGESKQGKPWKKLIFAVEVQDGEYSNDMAFEIFGEDKVDKFNFAAGDDVTVHFNVRSNKWKESYFTSLGAWKIDGNASGSSTPSEEENDMPF
jgi:hypothetical protein